MSDAPPTTDESYCAITSIGHCESKFTDPVNFTRLIKKDLLKSGGWCPGMLGALEPP